MLWWGPWGPWGPGPALPVRRYRCRSRPAVMADDDIAQLRDVIDWVGFVQGTLLEALDGRMGG